jgi:hypothetical protein
MVSQSSARGGPTSRLADRWVFAARLAAAHHGGLAASLERRITTFVRVLVFSEDVENRATAPT